MPFVKIDETVENKFPCLECKTLCAGIDGDGYTLGFGIPCHVGNLDAS